MKRFKRNQLYIHQNNTTVAFECMESKYNKETKNFELLVHWHSVNSIHSPWPMGVRGVEDIKIPLSKRNEWKEYKGSEPPKFKEWKQP